MRAAPATVIHVAGGAAASPLSGGNASAVSSPPLASRLRGREPSDGDDEPLLGSPTSASSAASVTAASRVRRCLSRVARTRLVASLLAVFSLSGSSAWLVKGLCVCLGMMLMGGVGSFTLHQLMSPQIESLLRQRNEMHVEMEALRDQVANQTRLAESRLEMIHMLEQELERQVAAAAAAAQPGVTGGPAVAVGRPSPPFASSSRQANFWTTLMYAAVLGSIVLMVLAIRVYQIARIEAQRTQKARASSDVGIGRRSGEGGNASAHHVALTLDGDDEIVGSGKLSTAASSSSAYKRAPLGSPPQDRLVHV